jgi:uncharacterized protein (TIGR03067 family)
MCCQFLLLLAVLIVGADDPADEAGKLQGTWAVVSAVGIDAPQEAVKRLKVVIRRETIHIMAPDGVDAKAALREREKANFKLDPSKKPKAIDLSKDPSRLSARGIYELDGDTLKLAWRKEGPRPTEFPTRQRPREFTGGAPENNDLVLMVLKKEKQP